MGKKLIHKVRIINEGKDFEGYVIVDGLHFECVEAGNYEGDTSLFEEVIDGSGKILIPGLIDDQVHFREPGLTHKAEIATESRAAVAGGITSFMEMPNTNPQTLTQELLEEKYQRAAAVSPANYSFYMGASNDNLEEVLKTDPKTVCGVKVFMGSSTGNMLVDNKTTLEQLFSQCKMLIATHCEDEATIRKNSEAARAAFGEEVPIAQHPIIRDEEACYLSSSMAVELAKKHGTKLHILHISTEKETHLFEAGDLKHKNITSEACVHHMWFNDQDYEAKGTAIKWNPAVKSEKDRLGIIQALKDDRIDVIATDHAPHTKEEKNNTYFNAPSGGPLVQHVLLALLDLAQQGDLDLNLIVKKTSHAVADLFEIEKRGYIKPGYFADFVLIDTNTPYSVKSENILSKCGWSPFEGHTFKNSIHATYVNGSCAYKDGNVNDDLRGMRMTFER